MRVGDAGDENVQKKRRLRDVVFESRNEKLRGVGSAEVEQTHEFALRGRYESGRCCEYRCTSMKCRKDRKNRKDRKT